MLCFAAISDELEAAVTAVLDDESDIIIPGDPDIIIKANSIAELCAFLDVPLVLTTDQIEDSIDLFIASNPGLEDEVRDLIECLIQAGAIIEEPTTCIDCFNALGETLLGQMKSIR